MNITYDQVALDSIRKRFNLSLLLLFGSQAENKSHSQSDIDIAVMPKDTRKKVETLKLIHDLSQAFSSTNIDLVNLDKANPLLLKNITDQAVVLSGKKQDLEKQQLRALHLYNDYLPYFDLEKMFVKNKLKDL